MGIDCKSRDVVASLEPAHAADDNPWTIDPGSFCHAVRLEDGDVVRVYGAEWRFERTTAGWRLGACRFENGPASIALLDVANHDAATCMPRRIGARSTSSAS